MSLELKEALRKLKKNNYSFDLLPSRKNDILSDHFLSDPLYNLSLCELIALKNARFYTIIGGSTGTRDEPIMKYDTNCCWVPCFFDYYVKITYPQNNTDCCRMDCCSCNMLSCFVDEKYKFKSKSNFN